MADLTVNYQGVKGKDIKQLGNKQGLCSLWVDDKFNIKVDMFEGMGETYKKREHPHIEVKYGTDFKFKFNSEIELIETLQKAEKINEAKEILNEKPTFHFIKENCPEDLIPERMSCDTLIDYANEMYYQLENLRDILITEENK